MIMNITHWISLIDYYWDDTVKGKKLKVTVHSKSVLIT